MAIWSDPYNQTEPTIVASITRTSLGQRNPREIQKVKIETVQAHTDTLLDKHTNELTAGQPKTRSCSRVQCRYAKNLSNKGNLVMQWCIKKRDRDRKGVPKHEVKHQTHSGTCLPAEHARGQYTCSQHQEQHSSVLKWRMCKASKARTQQSTEGRSAGRLTLFKSAAGKLFLGQAVRERCGVGYHSWAVTGNSRSGSRLTRTTIERSQRCSQRTAWTD